MIQTYHSYTLKQLPAAADMWCITGEPDPQIGDRVTVVEQYGADLVEVEYSLFDDNDHVVYFCLFPVHPDHLEELL